jgi:predicted esterase
MSITGPLMMALALAGAATTAHPAAAQQFPPGEVVEDVVSLSDPSQSYAVYLPSYYGPDRNWPILFAMDPRGRATIPIELFRDAAERYGYIILSSYNTASDTSGDPNTPAMRAMLADTPRLFHADERRIYLTGFSGTARVGWYFASQLGEFAAGLIGFGAGLPTPFTLPDSLSFAFFGAAGRADFNYEEMVALDAALASRGAVHRFVSFDGPHGWGGVDTCSAALDWMELQAMRSGRREVEPSLVEELYSARLSAAGDREVAGDIYGAFRLYRDIAEDFTGLRDVEEATDKVAVLERTAEVREQIELEERLRRRSDDYFEVLSGFLRQVQTVNELPQLADSLRDLRISALKRQAENSSNRLEAEAAQRLLEKVFVNAAFYGPRDFLRAGEPWRALHLLGVADAIKPDDFNVLVNFARAYAVVGNEKEAIEALRRADAIVTLQAAWLEEDPYLQALADEPEFQAFLRRD